MTLSDYLTLTRTTAAQFARSIGVNERETERLDALAAIGVHVAIGPTPNEMDDAIPFATDEIHRAYDADAAHRFWRALIVAHALFTRFRSGFLGKASLVHFFWGSFDLAVTRFSGRPALLHPGGAPHLPDAIVRVAYSHEVSSAGFWPGNDAYPHAAFYSYAYPVPSGFAPAHACAGANGPPHSANGFCHGTGRAPPPIPRQWSPTFSTTAMPPQPTSPGGAAARSSVRRATPGDPGRLRAV